MDTQLETVVPVTKAQRPQELQFIPAPETQTIPTWEQVISKTKDELSTITDENMGKRFSSHAEVVKARQNEEEVSKEATGDRQRAINELVGARKGFDTLSRFETYFRMKPALDQKKQEVEQVVSSLEKRIANKQFAGMSQMEMGQQLEEERRLLAQVNQEISTIIPDELKDETILKKRGFWTDARRTSNKAVEELIRLAKEENKPAEIQGEAELQESVDINTLVDRSFDENGDLVGSFQDLARSVVTVDDLTKVAQRVEDKIVVSIPHVDGIPMKRGEPKVYQREGLEEIKLDRITLAMEALDRGDTDAFLNLNLTLEEATEFTQRRLAQIDAISKDLAITSAVTDGVYKAGRIVMRPGGEPGYPMGILPERKLKEMSTSNKSPVVEDKTISIRVKGLLGKAGKAVATGALLYTLAHSSGVGVQKPVQASIVEPAGKVAQEVKSTPFPSSPQAREIPVPPVPDGTPGPDMIKKSPPVVEGKKETITPTPTIEVPPTQAPGLKTEATPTPTSTASVTPTSTPEATQPLETPAANSENTEQNPFDAFLSVPIEVKGTVWDSIKFPEKFFTTDWVNPMNNTMLHDVVKDMLTNWLRPKLAQNNQNVDNLPDGMLLDLTSLLTDEQKDLLKRAIETTSFDQYNNTVSKDYQQMLLQQGR